MIHLPFLSIPADAIFGRTILKAVIWCWIRELNNIDKVCIAKTIGWKLTSRRKRLLESGYFAASPRLERFIQKDFIAKNSLSFRKDAWPREDLVFHLDMASANFMAFIQGRIRMFTAAHFRFSVKFHICQNSKHLYFHSACNPGGNIRNNEWGHLGYLP